MRYVCLFAALAPALIAQQAGSEAAGPQFEVASIRPSAPLDATSKVGIHMDKQQFRAVGLSMTDYLGMARQMRNYQIQGPDWLASERFDIVATLPPQFAAKAPDAKELASLMSHLFDERFQIKSHSAKKEFPVYALEQGKEGIRATASALEAENGALSVGAGASGNGTTVALGRGTAISVGDNRIDAKKYSMVALADTLARLLDKPVVNQTGLGDNDTYDFTLEMTPEDFQVAMIRGALAAGVPLPPQVLRMLDAPSGDSLHQALAKIGLKMESKKLPLDILVLDSISRTPTAN